MIFPCKCVQMENGCIAIWREKSWRTKIAGPQLEKRPSKNYESRCWAAARLSYHLNVKKIPRRPPSLKRGLVLHTCDVSWCINPKHLYLGTARQNMNDLFERNGVIRSKISSARKGSKASLEARANMSEAGRKRRHSKKVRLKMSNSANKRWSLPPSEATLRNLKSHKKRMSDAYRSGRIETESNGRFKKWRKSDA